MRSLVNLLGIGLIIFGIVAVVFVAMNYAIREPVEHEIRVETMESEDIEVPAVEKSVERYIMEERIKPDETPVTEKLPEPSEDPDVSATPIEQPAQE